MIGTSDLAQIFTVFVIILEAKLVKIWTKSDVPIKSYEYFDFHQNKSVYILFGTPCTCISSVKMTSFILFMNKISYSIGNVKITMYNILLSNKFAHALNVDIKTFSKNDIYYHNYNHLKWFRYYLD